MQVCQSVSSIREKVLTWKQKGLKVAFVPTMGNLHDGHLSLVKLAQQKADKVVVSIFVNPMQFGPNEDLDAYPRTFEQDKHKLEAMSLDAVFYPAVSEIYPNGVDQTQVCVPLALTGLLEGASRPGHFDGVTTVVAKLFNMVQPDVAVFGQKDYQQLKVIQKMVEEMAMPIKIVAGPIGRDADGLALSSRNQYLSDSQRKIAPQLYQVLKEVERAILEKNGQFEVLTQAATQKLLALGFDGVDYIKVVDSNILLPLSITENSPKLPGLVILGVARLGKTRILDNILLEKG